MDNDKHSSAYTANAREARANLDPASVKGRSQSTFAVLTALAEAQNVLTAVQIGALTGLNPGNTARILLSLWKRGQIARDGRDAKGEKPTYSTGETAEGLPIPVRSAFTYVITDSGIARMQWLSENKPWHRPQS